MKYYFICFAALSISLLSCSDDESVDNNPMSTPYFPTDLMVNNEYLVEERVYLNEGNTIDTSIYYLQEKITSTFIDDTESTNYVIDRSRRSDQSAPWSFTERVNVTISDGQVILNDRNLKFIKLILPINTGDTWDGNRFFDDELTLEIGGETIEYFKNWESKYTNTGQSVTVAQQKYDDVVSVELANTENRLELRYGLEQYAPLIGLIYRELRILDTQCFAECNNASWEEKAEKGVVLIQQLINHN